MTRLFDVLQVAFFALEEANEALAALRGGKIRGAAMLIVDATGCEAGSVAARPRVKCPDRSGRLDVADRENVFDLTRPGGYGAITTASGQR